MVDSQITRARGRPRKIIREIVKKVLEFNDLDWNMVYDRTLQKFDSCSQQPPLSGIRFGCCKSF